MMIVESIRAPYGSVRRWLGSAGWLVVRFLSASASTSGFIVPPIYAQEPFSAEGLASVQLTREERRRWRDLERALRM